MRGSYGTGKTLSLRLVLSESIEKGFIGSYVVLDTEDCRFDRMQGVYREIMKNLQTKDGGRGSLALSEILAEWNKNFFKDRWREFRTKKHELAPDAPYLMAVLQAYFTKPEMRTQIISWLMGDPNIPFDVKRQFEIRGDIEDETALYYLSGLSRLIRQAGYTGLTILFDELESITQLPRSLSRSNALENVRILDENAKYAFKHSYFVYAGTHDFFEGERGIPSYSALEGRLRTYKLSKASYREPILDVGPLLREERVDLLSKLKELYEVAYGIDTSQKLPKRTGSNRRNGDQEGPRHS